VLAVAAALLAGTFADVMAEKMGAGRKTTGAVKRAESPTPRLTDGLTDAERLNPSFDIKQPDLDKSPASPKTTRSAR